MELVRNLAGTQHPKQVDLVEELQDCDLERLFARRNPDEMKVELEAGIDGQTDTVKCFLHALYIVDVVDLSFSDTLDDARTCRVVTRKRDDDFSRDGVTHGGI